MVQRSTPRLPGAERRNLILGAAGELFGQRGYEGARLDDIAGAAGVTKPVLYRHFDSKQALYLALLERHRDDLGRFAATWPATGTAEERVRATLDGWVDYVEGHSYAWKLIFRDSGGGVEIREFRTEVNDRARAVLGDLIGALNPRIPTSQHEPLAQLMSMGMASLVLWWIDHPEVSRMAIVDAMTRVWVGLLDGAAAP